MKDGSFTILPWLPGVNEESPLKGGASDDIDEVRKNEYPQRYWLRQTDQRVVQAVKWEKKKGVIENMIGDQIDQEVQREFEKLRQ